MRFEDEWETERMWRVGILKRRRVAVEREIDETRRGRGGVE